MDFGENDNVGGFGGQKHGGTPYQQPSHIPPMQPAGPIGGPVGVGKRKKGRGWRIFWGIFISLSVLANFVLFMMLIFMSMAVTFGVSSSGIFTEDVIQEGPRGSKIVVINVMGVLAAERAQDVYQQLKAAREDSKVKGLIVRVNSPGGTISASDQIYNEILKFRRKEGKPVVAFMQGVAASGGYYASVACDKIVAEPTTITGSIGVIMGHFVLEKLLEEKLGIEPVILKSGPFKDVPSSFREMKPEEEQYLRERLIDPAYERFVKVIDDGRDSLTLTEVKELANGSIYGAPQARDAKLIDTIGYLDDAIDELKSLANLEKALVVEYRKPFSLGTFLGAQSRSILKLDRTMLYELTTPQLLYLWTGRQ